MPAPQTVLTLVKNFDCNLLAHNIAMPSNNCILLWEAKESI